MVSPEQEGQGDNLFVGVVLLPVQIGVMAVAEAH